MFHDDGHLVMHHTAALPLVCLKTGRADRQHRVDGVASSFPVDTSRAAAAAVVVLGVPFYRLEIPVSRSGSARQRCWRRLAPVYDAAGFAIGVAAIWRMWLIPAWTYALAPRPVAQVPPWQAILVGACRSAGDRCGQRDPRHCGNPTLTLTYVAGGFLWIGGAHKRYLRTLDPWPIPKPTFWQSLFRWNPHGPCPQNSTAENLVTDCDVEPQSLRSAAHSCRTTPRPGRRLPHGLAGHRRLSLRTHPCVASRPPLPQVRVRTGLPSDDLATLVLASILEDDRSVEPLIDGKGNRFYEAAAAGLRTTLPTRQWRRPGIMLVLAGLLVAVTTHLLPYAGMIGSRTHRTCWCSSAVCCGCA